MPQGRDTGQLKQVPRSYTCKRGFGAGRIGVYPRFMARQLGETDINRSRPSNRTVIEPWFGLTAQKRPREMRWQRSRRWQQPEIPS